MILSLRVLPGFAVALEERDNPALHAFPLVIGRSGGRGLVLECNLVARRCGITPGITLAQARHHCPEVRIRFPAPERHAAVWEEIVALLSRVSPLVQPLAPGEAVCDLAGCERHWRDVWELAGTLLGAIRTRTGILPAIGIGPNRLVAELASALPGPDGITIVDTGREGDFLKSVPLTALPEVDADLALAFSVLGLTTAGQFAALPAAAVKSRFGARGERLHRYAMGIDTRPIVPPRPRAAISARSTCEDGTPEEALAVLHPLATRIAAELAERDLHPTLITVRVIVAGSPPVDEPAGPHWSPSPSPVPVPPGRPESKPRLPIPYRIHSYALPVPNEPISHPLPPQLPVPIPSLPPVHPPPMAGTDTASTLVRTPIGAASDLEERARVLLVGRLNARCVDPSISIEAVELEVSEFAEPRQHGFSELNRIDGTGGLAGMTPERRSALLRDDVAWTARHGRTAFRHVASVDPANVVTERRVRWAEGLEETRRRA